MTSRLVQRLFSDAMVAVHMLLHMFAFLRLWFQERLYGSCGIDKFPPPKPKREKTGGAPANQVDGSCCILPGDDTEMLIVGHRGASAWAPENSMASFRLTFESGISGIELDIRSSRDGRVFVLHDRTLRRTCLASAKQKWAKSGVLDTPVSELDWKTISQIPIGIHNGQVQYPPLLSAVLDLSQQPMPQLVDPKTGKPVKRVVFVEFKAHHEAICQATSGIVRRLTSGSRSMNSAASVDTLKGSDKANVPACEVRFISFNIDCLKRMKTLRPLCKCYLLVALPPCPFGCGGAVRRLICRAAQTSISAGLDGLDINADPAVISKHAVDYCRSRGQEVVVWVSPTAKETCALYCHMIHSGITAFTSDIPQAMLDWNAAVVKHRP